MSVTRASWVATLVAVGFGFGALGITSDVRAAAEGFDRAAAAEVLGSVDVGKCKRRHTALGEGHVVVTFETSGVASSAIVDRGPFKGKVVSCVEKAFKRTKVPPFKGDAIHVGKMFKIE